MRHSCSHGVVCRLGWTWGSTVKVLLRKSKVPCSRGFRDHWVWWRSWTLSKHRNSKRSLLFSLGIDSSCSIRFPRFSFLAPVNASDPDKNSRGNPAPPSTPTWPRLRGYNQADKAAPGIEMYVPKARRDPPFPYLRYQDCWLPQQWRTRWRSKSLPPLTVV